MRRFILILFIVGGVSPAFTQTVEQLSEICISRLDDATYLRDFQVELEAAVPGQSPPIARYSMVLSKDTQYRLSICNSDTSPGTGIIQVFDNRGMIGSNFVASSGTVYPQYDIQIQSTGVYHIFISFQDGQAGTAVGVLSFVKRL